MIYSLKSIDSIYIQIVFRKNNIKNTTFGKKGRKKKQKEREREKIEVFKEEKKRENAVRARWWRYIFFSLSPKKKKLLQFKENIISLKLAAMIQ